MAEREVRRFTAHFPWSFGGGWVPDEPTPSGGAKLRELLAASPENRDLPLDEEPFKTALDMAEFLDGVPRNPKMHPCGVVLSRQPMHELTPTFIANKGYPTTHYDMDAVEVIGLVKVDVLAQGGLAVMRDVKESLARRGIEVDLQTCTARQIKLEKSEIAAPLTPALSLGERGNHIQSHGKLSDGHCRTNIQKKPDTRWPSPLPGGGRQGENSPQHISRFEPLNRDGSAGLRPGSLMGRTCFEPRREAGAPDQCEGEVHEQTHFFDAEVQRNRQSSIGNQQFDDPRVWDLISGGARAVHHIESPAMTSLCRQCNVRDIDTLIAIVSVIRPGAANQGKKLAFTRRYQKLEPVTYPHPSLEPVLNDTFGLVVYEEHILQICEAFAGLPPGRADVLRRALNKQKRAVIAEIQQEFFASARARGHDDEKIAEVWGLVTGFAGYAFCKAHSTAYGVEAYQSAWLKLNYPAEFMAAVLTNGKGFYDPLVYVLESYRLGLKFLPPTVNEPGPGFMVVDGKTSGQHSTFNTQHATSNTAIRVPLTRTKGLAERTIQRLLAEHKRGPFTSLADFHRRVQPLPEEMEAMIRAGGFDEFGETRTRQFWEARRMVKAESRNGKAEAGNRNLEFDFEAGKNPVAEFFSHNPALLREPTRRERLEAETELFGYAVSGHPLELFDDIAWDTYCPVSRLGDQVGETVTACGLVVEQRTHHQITGEPMKFLTLADWTGIVETELFAQTYKNYGLATVRYPVLEVTATVEPFENGRGFSLRVLRAGKPRNSDAHKSWTPKSGKAGNNPPAAGR